MHQDLNKPVTEREYINIYMRADETQQVFKREGYAILTYLGDLVGLLDVVCVFGSVTTALLSSKLFKASLISQLYRI